MALSTCLIWLSCLLRLLLRRTLFCSLINQHCLLLLQSVDQLAELVELILRVWRLSFAGRGCGHTSMGVIVERDAVLFPLLCDCDKGSWGGHRLGLILLQLVMQLILMLVLLQSLFLLLLLLVLVMLQMGGCRVVLMCVLLVRRHWGGQVMWSLVVMGFWCD